MINKPISVIEMLEIATGWDKVYMTDNPDKVVEILTEIKVDARTLGINGGWVCLEDIKKYIINDKGDIELSVWHPEGDIELK
tara:strand:- start:2603 stop:2848 length:246 start_codon:yes stop_codon:yes gene_type:complete